VRRPRAVALLGMALGFLAVCGVLWPAPPATAGTVWRGIDDGRLSTLAPDVRAQHLQEIAGQLRAGVLRVDCQWPLAEPAEGQYSDSGYLGGVVATVEAAHTLGLKVIVTMDFVPKWASDTSYWNTFPARDYAGYQKFYPMKPSALGDYQAFAEHLSGELKGQVLGYEAYSEPNLWVHLFPQWSAADPSFSAHLYLRYLRSFFAGVRAGDPGAMVIAGSTAPTGAPTSDRSVFWTSPQSFARALAGAGAARYFDVYSHHPYVPGGSGNMDPGLPPADSSHTVSLSNIGTLLKIFPGKPFYLTEYGFSTEPSRAFGPPVTEVQQATWLSKAYGLAAGHPQIKLLVWYLLQDTSPTGKPTSPDGWYLGLRRVSGIAKPAWYAFARGNHISLVAPARAPRGAHIVLSGSYACASIGGVAGKRLLIERRKGAGSWRVVVAVRTGARGHYSARVVLGATERWRVVFAGVVKSPLRLVVARRAT
jgi:hypothetical protein